MATGDPLDAFRYASLGGYLSAGSAQQNLANQMYQGTATSNANMNVYLNQGMTMSQSEMEVYYRRMMAVPEPVQEVKKKVMRAIDVLRAEITEWHGDILGRRCPA